MDEEKMRQLREHGHYYSVPRGVSMWPMLINMDSIVDIVPCSGKLNKYDVALYWSEARQKCVLHRVLDVEDSNYIFCGDNCWRKENVPCDTVMGVAVQFKRKPDLPWMSVEDWHYRLYVHVWCDFLLLRRGICWARDKGKRLVHKFRARFRRK